MLGFGISIIRCVYIDLPCASKQNYYEVMPCEILSDVASQPSILSKKRKIIMK